MHIPRGRRHSFEKTLFCLVLPYACFLVALLCFELCYDHCGHFHMTIMCLIKLFICFTSCLFDRFLLVTLYFSFYHLIYLEGLMRFVQVFQVTCIYVSSSSQVSDLGVSEFCHYSQTHV